MKKSLITIVAASTLLLASCAKQVSFEEAKKHCDDNFTSTELKAFAVHSRVEVKKAEGVLAKLFTVGVEEDDDEAEYSVATSASLELYGDSATYKVDGKKLIIETSVDVKKFIKDQLGLPLPESTEFSGSISGKASTDDAGYPLSEELKYDFSLSYTEAGLSVSGAVQYEAVTTFTAK